MWDPSVMPASHSYEWRFSISCTNLKQYHIWFCIFQWYVDCTASSVWIQRGFVCVVFTWQLRLCFLSILMSHVHSLSKNRLLNKTCNTGRNIFSSKYDLGIAEAGTGRNKSPSLLHVPRPFSPSSVYSLRLAASLLLISSLLIQLSIHPLFFFFRFVFNCISWIPLPCSAWEVSSPTSSCVKANICFRNAASEQRGNITTLLSTRLLFQPPSSSSQGSMLSG